MSRPRRRLTQDCCELQIEPAPPRDRHRHSRLHVRRQRARAIARATRRVDGWRHATYAYSYHEDNADGRERDDAWRALKIRELATDRAPYRDKYANKRSSRDLRLRDRERAEAEPSSRT